MKEMNQWIDPSMKKWVDPGVGNGVFWKCRTFVCYPLLRLRRKVSFNKKSGPENLYTGPEISNPNLTFKLRWAQKSPVGTSDLFSIWRQLWSPWVWRFLDSTLRYYYLFLPIGVYYPSSSLVKYINHQKDKIFLFFPWLCCRYVYIWLSTRTL